MTPPFPELMEQFNDVTYLQRAQHGLSPEEGTQKSSANFPPTFKLPYAPKLSQTLCSPWLTVLGAGPTGNMLMF